MAETAPTPLRYGVDDAGGPAHIETMPWAAELFRELGLNLMVFHATHSRVIEENIEIIERKEAFCSERGMEWVYNLESANWLKTFVDEHGRDWFNREDGRHYELLPPAIRESLGEQPNCLGVMYDEAAHMQNCRNKIANNQEPWKYWMYDPAGDQLEGAADAFTEAVAETGALYRNSGVPLFTEHVFPVLYHCFARAGWTPCTKILKENWSPIFIACAMGAAIQYDKELWITPDLWGTEGYPTHDVDRYRSALLLAYHMGANTIYTENLAFDNMSKGPAGLTRVSEDGYEILPHGEVTRWFIKEYVPAHPRYYEFTELKPRTVIIRRPDACWGEGNGWLGNTLFGNPDWPTTPATEAWLNIWHILTRGVVPTEAISWHGDAPYPEAPYQVLCPLDGVVAYDDRVGYDLIKDAEVIFLTGVGVSEDTLAAVERCVEEGATCVSLKELAPPDVAEAAQPRFNQGQGRWVMADTFLEDHVREAVADVLPEPGTIRYRFGGHAVTFRAIDGDANRIEASVEAVSEQGGSD